MLKILIRAAFIFLLTLIGTVKVFGQLSFCNGVGGPPIYKEDFGQGTTNGPPLPAGVTNYVYKDSNPQDGAYTVTNNMQVLPAAHNTGDHTGNENGKALVVNADFTPGIFYQTPIEGLCENTTYEFSAWLLNIYDPKSNVCPDAIPINVRFEIWDATDTYRLAGGDTGDIHETSTPQWQHAGLTFTSEAGQGSIILKMINNGAGGCGNDLAIDDIQFKTCGDATDIMTTGGQRSTTVCASAGAANATLQTEVKNSVYASPVYQWEVSPDGINFTDISGAVNPSYTTPLLNKTTYYRARIAEDQVNLTNSLCNNYTSIFKFAFADDPPIPVASDTEFVLCDGNPVNLKAEPLNGAVIDWYDSPSGGTLLAEATGTLVVDHGGQYFAEARLPDAGCTSEGRAAFNVREDSSPQVSDETVFKCASETITLEAGAEADSYRWDSGETTPEIIVSNAGAYNVTLFSPLGCQSTRIITVVDVEAPVIQDVVRQGNFIEVMATGNSALRYSLDGINFQEDNTFELPQDPIGTVFVMDEKGCTTVKKAFQFLVVPDYFTPNGDGYNDLWEIRGLRVYKKVHIAIFDRFGKLLKQVQAPPYQWNGIYRGESLPSSTYWYLIEADDKEIKGKVLLKR